MTTESGADSDITRAIRLLAVTITGAVLLALGVMAWVSGLTNLFGTGSLKVAAQMENLPAPASEYWQPPDIRALADRAGAEEITYGRELIAHTARYLGPKGSVQKISNGMNCQNCHLDAGTKTFGNNYSAVSATYPKFRARSGKVESIEKRVNDCFERSLNGRALDSASREMRAIVSYIQWLGSGVEKGKAPKGSGLAKLETPGRAADPANGKQLYALQCIACHGKDGQGMKQPDGIEYQFPPLWGEQSYNQGAGLFRLSTFAQYIRSNMPLGTTFDHPVLSEEQAWDIAAYINSQPRPGMDVSRDWPKIESKPFDHPFGPYADPFTEKQHKYGPYEEIRKFYNEKNSREKS